MNLTEWTTQNIKFRDCLKKQIKDVKVSEGKIIVTEKKGDLKTYLIKEDLSELITKIKDETTILVCLNNQKNTQSIITNWEKLKKYQKLTIICVNINSNNNWTIHPNTHDKITDKESLEEGIKALAEEKN